MATMSDDLTARITAALDEVQRDAEAAIKQTHTSRRMIGDQMVDVPIRPSRWRGAAWTPEQVLDLIAAHREIVQACQDAIENGTLPAAAQARIILPLVAKAHRIE